MIVFGVQALDMIRGKNIPLLMDSHLEGNFSTEEATVVFELASQCLQYEPRERPSPRNLVETLAPLQNKPDVISLIYAFFLSNICNCSCPMVHMFTLVLLFLVGFMWKFSTQFDLFTLSYYRLSFWSPGFILHFSCVPTPYCIFLHSKMHFQELYSK